MEIIALTSGGALLDARAVQVVAECVAQLRATDPGFIPAQRLHAVLVGALEKVRLSLQEKQYE